MRLKNGKRWKKELPSKLVAKCIGRTLLRNCMIWKKTWVSLNHEKKGI